MIARPFAAGEALRRCACGHVVVARVGDICPRPGCHRVFPDVAAIHDTLVAHGRNHGAGEVQRLAPVLGIQGDRLVTDGRRIFGVINGGR